MASGIERTDEDLGSDYFKNMTSSLPFLEFRDNKNIYFKYEFMKQQLYDIAQDKRV